MSSCEKNPVTPPEAKEPYASLPEFFAKNGAQYQIFTLDASVGGVITGSEGTKITFPQHAFQFLNGNSVTGNVSISLREVYTKSEMILSQMTTTSFNSPLTSGGMFSLLAYQGSEPLYMASGKSYTAELPSPQPDPAMKAYVLTADSAGMTWVSPPTYEYDTTGWGTTNYYASLLVEATGYLYTSNYFGWTNCDYPWTSGPVINLSMQGTDAISDYSTTLWLIFKGNTAIQIYPSNYIPGDFIYDYAPVDSTATLVALGLRDSILYSAFVPVTIGNANQSLNFTLQKTTTDSFKAAIDIFN